MLYLKKQKHKEGKPLIDCNLSKKEINKQLKKITELNNYRKYYQNKFFNKHELVDNK